jgi:hypothetical protein
MIAARTPAITLIWCAMVAIFGYDAAIRHLDRSTGLGA